MIDVSLITKMKQEAKSHLDLFKGQERLEIALDNYRSALELGTNESAIKAVVLAMSALHQHQRDGGLKPSQIKELSSSIRDILALLNILPRGSELSFLHEELHVVESLIARSESDHWSSMWSLLLAIRSSPRTDYYRHKLGIAIRLFRMGYGHQSYEYFMQAAQLTTDSAERMKCLTGCIKVLRLSAKLIEAKSLIDQVTADYPQVDSTDPRYLEFEWEEICLKTAAKQGYKRMVAAVSPKSTHHAASYCLEAKLWMHALPTTKGIKALPKLESMRRNPNLDMAATHELAKVVGWIESLYDNSFDIDYRLKRAGNVLARAQHLLSVEHHLLAQACVVRWLGRRKQSIFLEFATNAYARLSQEISDGRTRDCLGFMFQIDDEVCRSIIEIDHQKKAG